MGAREDPTLPLPEILFKGVPRGFTRGHTAALIQHLQPKRVVIPCIGAYSICSTVVDAGVPPSHIEGCDITLYSSVIGAMLSGQELDVRPVGEWEWLEPHMHDAVGKVAAVLFAVRLLQYQGSTPSAYNDQRIAELVRRRDVYLERLRDAAEAFKAKLGGIQYRACDMRELMEPYHDDPQTLLLCNPPRYTGGFDKMFAGLDDAFEWPNPEVPQFTEAGYQDLLDWLAEGKAPALVYYASPTATGEDPAEEFGPPWVSVFAHRPKLGATAAINWILSNRPLPANLARQDVPKPAPPPRPLFLDGEIRPDSVLEVVKVKAEEANYYRDLFVHKLPLVKTERYNVVLIDGQVAGVLGWHLANTYTSAAPGVAELTFCFSPPHKRYARLQKLMLMSATSRWYLEHLAPEAMGDLAIPITRVHTTMLTNRPEVKTARGVFQLMSREVQKDGSYKLHYGTNAVERTQQETLQAWLAGAGQK